MPHERPLSLRFPRAWRLRQTREFSAVRNRGQRATRGCLVMNWLPLPPGSPSRLGVVTSKKLGKATVRTRARRLLRETFRLHQHEFLEPTAFVLVARHSIIG